MKGEFKSACISVSSGEVLLRSPCSFTHFNFAGGSHVEGHVSVHVHLAALPQAGAGLPGVGGRPASFGSQESHDQGPSASGPLASPQAAEAAGGPGPSTSGALQGHGRPQHLPVWGHEGSVCGAEGPRHGQRPDGDGARGDGVGPRDG